MGIKTLTNGDYVWVSKFSEKPPHHMGIKTCQHATIWLLGYTL